MVLWLCAFGAACIRDSGAELDPRPQHVVPSWGVNTGPVSVVIEGENFLEVPTQHIGGEEPVTVDARFEAFLGEVALEDVTRADDRSLRARIPEGLPPGWYSLVVVGPLGRRVELPRAYYSSDRMLARLDAGVRLQRTQFSVGEQIRLLLEVENTGGTTASAVTPVLRPVGEGQVNVITGPEPADIAPGGSAPFTWELSAFAPGDMSLTLEVQGVESTMGVELRAPAVEPVPLQIRERAVLTSSLTVSPRVVNVGQTVTLTLRVTNPGEIAVKEVVPGGPEPSGSLAMFASGPEPASADIPAGESRDFQWTYTVGLAGTLVFQVGAVGRDAHSGVEVLSPEARSEDVDVRMSPGLVARFLSLPSVVKVGQELDVKLEVSNPRDSAVLQVEILDARLEGGGIMSLVSWPLSERVKDIPSKGSAVFNALLVATGEGSCSFSAAARGKDASDGTVVSAPRTTSSLLTVRRSPGHSVTRSAPASRD